MKKLTLAILIGMPVQAATLELNPKRTVEVIDVVNGSMFPEVVHKIDALSRASSDPIDILINSPGGAVHVGTSILDVMHVAKSRGVKFRCVSGVIAASMAFIILAECDERYVLAGTKLLFHPVSSDGRGRVQELMVSYEQIMETEQEIMTMLREKMGLPWKKFHMHYFAETMWSGTGLNKHTGGKFLTIVDDVSGTDKLFVFEKPRKSLLEILLGGQAEQVKQVMKKAGLVFQRDVEISTKGVAK